MVAARRLAHTTGRKDTASPRRPAAAADMDPSAPSGSSADASASSSSSAVEDLAPGMAAMSLQDRFELLRGIGEECIQEDELMNLLQKKPVPICYDGFEPSGRMHIAQVR